MGIDPISTIVDATSGVIKGITGVVSEYVVDKDKQNEINFKIQELVKEFATTIVTTKTVPWVDAAVKLMYAFRDCLIPMFRPVFSGALAIFGCYLSYKGIETGMSVQDQAYNAGFAAPLMQWIHSRGQEKKHAVTTELKKDIVAKDDTLSKLIGLD